MARRTPAWVQVLVAVHVVAMTSWSLPYQSQPFRSGLIKPTGLDWIPVANDRILRRYAGYWMVTSGTWQSWDLFAPNPARNDVWCDASVELQSGKRLHYQYPRMALLGMPEKYLKERYRKFYERAGTDENQLLWVPFAQRVALESFSDPADPPVRVSLTRHWRGILPPGRPQPTEYESYTYLVYDVDQELLRRAKEARR